jgi:hypothetical protein
VWVVVSYLMGGTVLDPGDDFDAQMLAARQAVGVQRVPL